MKTFEIISGTGETYINVEGEIITVNENTGQSIIFSKNDPTYTNIVAVIPATMIVIIK